MAAPNKESTVLSELQRAAFQKWRDSKNYNEVQSDFDCHIGVTLNIREDGSVDVLLNELPHDRQLQAGLQDVAMNMLTDPYQPDDLDLAPKVFEYDNEEGVADDADICRPQKLYLYFLELQRLKAIKDLDPNVSSKGVLPRIPYEGGLSELQRAAFKNWNNDGEVDLDATRKFASLNLKDDDSMQPTMSSLKGNANTVLEVDPMLDEVHLQ